MPTLDHFTIKGPAIHPKIKTLLNESKFDLSDVTKRPQVLPVLNKELDSIPLEVKLALAEACLERVSLAVFAGCLKIEEFKFDISHPASVKYKLQCEDFEKIQNVLSIVDEHFEVDPLSIFVQLRSGVIDIHPLTYYAQYLYLAYLICFTQEEVIPRNSQETLLRLKFLYVYAMILDDNCPIIKQKLDNLLERDDKLADFTIEEQIEYFLILANGFLIYSEMTKAIEAEGHAKKLAEIDFEFVGEMGKRTYHQQKEVSQLFLNVLVKPRYFSATPGTPADGTPVALKLDDDTVMSEIVRSRARGDGEDRPDLYPIDLACMITSLAIMRKNEPMDEILFERSEAFVSELLHYKLVYGVQMSALLTRCLVESEKKRKIERACMQAEVLKNDLVGIHTAKGLTTELNVEQYRARLPLLLASNVKPFWVYSRAYASILLRLGSNAEALRVYNDIYDYDSLITCYISIGQAEKAETMAKNLLEIKETPYRLCLMGAITKDPTWFEKAIKLSNDNSSQARSSLGLMLMHRGDLEGAFVHLKRAAEIKPLQTDTLFSLGHVAYKLEKYADAVEAYRKCVNVEPNDHEPWNNLSASFVHLNRPVQAQKTIKEALKFNRNHPEMWRNYAIMSITVEEYGQAIHALQEYMKCSKKLDINEIVQQLLLSITQVKDESSFETLQKEAVLMMGQMSSKIILDADTLVCYSLLKKPPTDCQDENIFQGYLVTASKAIQKCISSTPWQSNEDAMFNALQVATDMLTAERNLNAIRPEGQKVAEHSARVVSIMKQAKDNFGDDFKGVEDDRLKRLLQKTTSMV